MPRTTRIRESQYLRPRGVTRDAGALRDRLRALDVEVTLMRSVATSPDGGFRPNHRRFLAICRERATIVDRLRAVG